MSASGHWIPQNDEEEELALALALSASLAESSSGKNSSAAPPASSGQPASHAHSHDSHRLPQYPQVPPQHRQEQPRRNPPAKVAAPSSSSSHGSHGAHPQPHVYTHGQPHGYPQQQQPYPYPHAPPSYPHVQPSHTPPHPQASAAQPARPPGPPQQHQPQASTSRTTAPPHTISTTSNGSSSSTSKSQRPGQQRQKRQMHNDPNACAGCGGALWGTYVTALNRKWHSKCFACGFCSEPLNEGGNTQFAVADDGWPYHMDCYRHCFHPVCHVCGTYITPRADGRVEYKEQPFWRESYCMHHLNDGTPQCCSCARYQSKGEEYVLLSDGRHLCLICIGSVVVDTRDAQPLYDDILAFYARMGMPLPQRAPMMLVDAHTLNEYSDREGKDTKGGGPVFHIRGLTLATVYRSIPSIVRAGGGGHMAVNSVSMPLAAERVTCSVSGILVLYGLPRLLTGCIIAHELMHAWLRMRNVAALSPKVEEGLCQLMAYIWLEAQHGTANGGKGLKDGSSEARLASFFAYQIREDTSVVYGDGFREAHEAFQHRGLTAVINDVLRHGRIC